MCFQARSSCFPAKRSFQICSHVSLELQLGSFLSATCRGLQHGSFCSCCVTIHIWSWLWTPPRLCPHPLLVNGGHHHAMLGFLWCKEYIRVPCCITLCHVLLCCVMLRYVTSRALQPSVQSYSQKFYGAMHHRQLVCPNIWWKLDSLLWLVTV